VSSRKRVTIKDVAAATGLSPAAVSYALRGVQTSPDTQERVRQAAEELGYSGNAVARALARGRTGLAGVLSGSLQDLSEQRFVEILGRQLGRHDLHMVVVDARGEPDRERMLARQLADRLVDGLVISPLDPSDPAWAEIGEGLLVLSSQDLANDANRASITVRSADGDTAFDVDPVLDAAPAVAPTAIDADAIPIRRSEEPRR